MILWNYLAHLVESFEVVDFIAVVRERVLDLGKERFSIVTSSALGHDLVVVWLLLQSCKGNLKVLVEEALV